MSQIYFIQLTFLFVPLSFRTSSNSPPWTSRPSGPLSQCPTTRRSQRASMATRGTTAPTSVVVPPPGPPALSLPTPTQTPQAACSAPSVSRTITMAPRCALRLRAEAKCWIQNLLCRYRFYLALLSHQTS